MTLLKALIFYNLLYLQMIHEFFILLNQIQIYTENILNDELNKVSDWLIANKLSLNVDKSSFLTFSSNKMKTKLNL